VKNSISIPIIKLGREDGNLRCMNFCLSSMKNYVLHLGLMLFGPLFHLSARSEILLLHCSSFCAPFSAVLGSTIGSCWDRPSALDGIDRQLLLGSTVGSWWDKSCAQTQQRTHAAFCISLAHFYNDEYRVFL
jgi:hypothetical protein